MLKLVLLSMSPYHLTAILTSIPILAPSSPPLPQLVLSRKINDLQVQAQHGARVNLARVGEMF